MGTPSEPHIERDLQIENADVQQEHIITQICPCNWFVTIDLKGVYFHKAHSVLQGVFCLLFYAGDKMFETFLSCSCSVLGTNWGFRGAH